jgi:hypothetical protein
MNLLAAVFAAFVLAIPSSAQDAASTGQWDARITAVTGEVVVHPAGGGDEVEGQAGLPLEEGDRVTTAAGASAEIALDGGSLIAVRENTDFTLENTQKNASIFSLTLGSILAKIQKLGPQRLSVRTPSSVAAVRGTEFGVDVEEGQSQETSVSRGMSPMRAAPLMRFAARRDLMRAHAQRLAAVRRSWKAIPAAQRRDARAKALERGRQRRLKRLNRSRQMHTPANREKRAEPRRKPRRKPDPKRKKSALKPMRRKP